MGKSPKCDCGKKPSWLYMPGHNQDSNDFYCDDCVPRGCSCNIEPRDGDIDNSDPDNWYEPVDEQGRRFPCCEFFYLDKDLLEDL